MRKRSEKNLSKKIELIHIKPWERDQYPDFKSKTELKKQKLMPGYHVKPRAIVEWKNMRIITFMTGTKPFHITNHREKRRGRGWKRKSGTKHELVKAVGRNFILICFATREYHSASRTIVCRLLF